MDVRDFSDRLSAALEDDGIKVSYEWVEMLGHGEAPFVSFAGRHEGAGRWAVQMMPRGVLSDPPVIDDMVRVMAQRFRDELLDPV